jgi:hypothetical protein
LNGIQVETATNRRAHAATISPLFAFTKRNLCWERRFPKGQPLPRQWVPPYVAVASVAAAQGDARPDVIDLLKRLDL